ncbi:MAG: hypothetical protein R2728_03410 [Chitinophagales bacterium]
MYNVKMAYDYMNDGDVDKDEMGKALELYHKAFELQPDNVEMKFWNLCQCR